MPVKNNGPGIRVPKVSAKYPAKAEIDFRSIANQRLESIRKIVREEMPEILNAVSEERMDLPDARMDSEDDFVRRIRNCFEIIRERVKKLGEDDPLERHIRKCADYTDQRELSEWRRSVRSALGLDIVEDYFIGTRYEGMLADWVRRNVSFVTSIEDGFLSDLEQAIIEGFTKGSSIKDISNELQSRFNVSKSKARLLARDQIGTLSSDLTRVRHEAAGVSEYYWDTSGDGKVRPCHAELDGKKFSYSNPPAMWYMTKHGKKYSGRRCNPGEDYQCRCIARPAFDFEKINTAAFKER